MAQYQRKHRRRRHRLRFPRLYALLSVLVVATAVVLGSIIFFRVDEVTVEGSTRYSVSEVISISGIEDGDNMFLVNKYQVADRLLSQLPYVDSVSLQRDFPSTIRITVTECEVAAAVEDAEREEWWLISSGGRLLERTDVPGDFLQVRGLTPAAPSVGTDLAVTEDQRLQKEALLKLLDAMEERDLLSMAKNLDLSSAGEVTFLYDGRLTVKLKLSADFDYEMRVLETVTSEYVDVKWSASDTGTLDRTQDDGLTHLIRDGT